MRNHPGRFDSADGHQGIAQYTVVLHTQPAHHLNLDRFLRFLRQVRTTTNIHIYNYIFTHTSFSLVVLFVDHFAILLLAETDTRTHAQIR